ncbi:hypothetical protein [Chitinophaga sancti]|uniref:YD repeat-containing protein n=1 Tax=Chitinophaga sancti TaxID=1004 RepID=A0A1K1SBW7_9BACT|nr:hypothetical protein [Chitinophaga sancti]WQD63581.1 hypothetical protein U0033_04175 [Chitinophaga sancti]WQG90793.1 hypothetical protein SR876_04740 [Chitinophaga sancti]SFW81848.1 hypothetical protein SAMN05661012_05152 [Chitinophaga sancti]
MKRYILILIYTCLILAGANVYGQSTCTCECLKPMFDYLIKYNRLYTPETDHITLASLLRDARLAGYDVSYTRCPILRKNINKYFYATSKDSTMAGYTSRIGDCEVNIAASSAINFRNLVSNPCSGTGDKVTYQVSGSSATATLSIGNCYTCTVQASALCYSAVTDTSVNLYTFGLAGNWRPSKSYIYYGNRAETQTTAQVAVRSGGTIADFAPFWQAVNKKWTARQDTTRWIWNSQTTLYNKKGLELETKDPLNRYTAGLYGYQDAMIIAATQNAHYREATYEGFEDYYYGLPACKDEGCSTGRNLDFSGFKSWIVKDTAHTGRYSLRIPGGSVAGISATIVQADTTSMSLSFNTGNNLCTNASTVLKSIRATQNALLPVFSPIAGKQIVVSCWIKEGQKLTGETYVHNRLSIFVKGAAKTDTVAAKPSGAIIEGWQRYEQIVTLPAGSTMLSIYLESLNNTTVFLDDLRIHPYNANMRSYVYDPGNLRLMAELDENNYATLFEYDDDGTLVRQKKETERGIKTISESRSALLKE